MKWPLMVTLNTSPFHNILNSHRNSMIISSPLLISDSIRDRKLKIIQHTECLTQQWMLYAVYAYVTGDNCQTVKREIIKIWSRQMVWEFYCESVLGIGYGVQQWTFKQNENPSKLKWNREWQRWIDVVASIRIVFVSFFFRRETVSRTYLVDDAWRIRIPFTSLHIEKLTVWLYNYAVVSV